MSDEMETWKTKVFKLDERIEALEKKFEKIYKSVHGIEPDQADVITEGLQELWNTFILLEVFGPAHPIYESLRISIRKLDGKKENPMTKEQMDFLEKSIAGETIRKTIDDFDKKTYVERYDEYWKKMCPETEKKEVILTSNEQFTDEEMKQLKTEKKKLTRIDDDKCKGCEFEIDEVFCEQASFCYEHDKFKPKEKVVFNDPCQPCKSNKICIECEYYIASGGENPTLGDGIPVDARFPATDSKPPEEPREDGTPNNPILRALFFVGDEECILDWNFRYKRKYYEIVKREKIEFWRLELLNKTDEVLKSMREVLGID